MKPSTTTSWKQPSPRRSPSLCGEGSSTTAECFGGTTASCAAICLCAPCCLVNLVILALYKVPRGLYRRALRRIRRRRLAKKEFLENGGDCEKKLGKVGSSQFAVHPLESKYDDGLDVDVEGEEEDEALEKEMWNRFHNGGFWRSLSRLETASPPP